MIKKFEEFLKESVIMSDRKEIESYVEEYYKEFPEQFEEDKANGSYNKLGRVVKHQFNNRQNL